jgi:hypothetical protein
MVQFYNQKLCKKKKQSNSLFFYNISKTDGDIINIVEEITPADDAFHGSPRRISAEWWYFDAIFKNNYSIHVGFRTISRKKIGIISPFFELYNNGILERQNKKRILLKNFETSKEYPKIKLFNKTALEFDKYKYREYGEWIYKIKYDFNDIKLNLIFKGIAKGFKIETNAESWTVSLPKSTVLGEIDINGKKIIVDGIGYHDHNWNYSFLSALTYGKAWFWGKIRSENYNIVWANVIKKSGKNDLIAIVNKDNHIYYNINPSNIKFESDEYIKDHHRKMPSKFLLKIDELIDNNKVKAEINMKVKNIHFSSVLFTPYWRYHVQNNGYISINNVKEQIDNIEIMEYLKFS